MIRRGGHTGDGPRDTRWTPSWEDVEALKPHQRPGSVAAVSEKHLMWVRALRQEHRLRNWGLGQCWDVADMVAEGFGWVPQFGVVLLDGGYVQPDHCWVVDPGGAVLDPTADQFGSLLQADVLLAAPGSAAIDRYRPMPTPPCRWRTLAINGEGLQLLREAGRRIALTSIEGEPEHVDVLGCFGRSALEEIGIAVVRDAFGDGVQIEHGRRAGELLAPYPATLSWGALETIAFGLMPKRSVADELHCYRHAILNWRHLSPAARARVHGGPSPSHRRGPVDRGEIALQG